jgi:hypothetical protein
VTLQVHAGTPERDSFRLQPEALLETGLAGQADASASTYDAVPGDLRARVVQGPGDLARTAREPGDSRYLAVGSDFATRDAGNGAADSGQQIPF